MIGRTIANSRTNQMKKEKNKGGRPTAYKKEYCEQAEKLCLLGATDAQMADFFGVGEKTINNWKEKHPEFLQSLKEAKGTADSRVERSLFERATGYSHSDVHISNYQGEITITPITKHYAPDITSMIFWLKNRQPEKWKDRIEHGGEISHRVKTIEIVRNP